MNKKLVLVILILLILPTVTRADTGPKPTVGIEVLYENSPIQEEFYGIMLDCNDFFENRTMSEDYCTKMGKEACDKLNSISLPNPDEGCNWRLAPMAWGYCNLEGCRFGYFPPKEFKIAIYLPSQDTSFITNEISRKNFRSSYEVNLESDGTATIKETTSILKHDLIRSFILALIITLISETLIAFIFLLVAKKPKKILLWVLLGSIITLPIVWFLISLLQNPWAVAIVGFVFATIFEAYFIYFLSKKELSIKQSSLLSILINLGSVAIGYAAIIASVMFGFNFY